jgi:multidrug efflux pump subunit AcrA (membrane-fusion protein)
VKRRRRTGWIATFIIVAAASFAGAGAYRMRLAHASTKLPSAPVRQGDFSVIVRCRGELKARRSVQLTAPVSVPDLRIVSLAPAGTPVKAGEVVIRFDPSSAKQQLQEKEAALKQAQATLDQEIAQAHITAEQDQRDLSTAQYAVEKARLEVSKQEIVSKLQGEESKIDLDLAEQDLKVKKAAVDLHAASDKAKTASLTRLRDQAQFDVDLVNHRLSQMEIKAPLDGVIVYLSNYSQGWVNAKPFAVGDQVWPGAAVAEIPDLNTLEMEGKVDEIDRGRIAQSDPARLRLDSIPELTIPAKLTGISLMTEMSFEWPPTSSFRAYAHVDHPDKRLRPGMNGSMDIEIQRLPKALSIPAKALFTRNGKAVVYVASGEDFRMQEVKVLARNPDEVAISGVGPGSAVSLVDLEKKDQKR